MTMENDKLKKLMGTLKVPEPDEKAREKTLKVAIEEFNRHQKAEEDIVKGFSQIRRLMDKTLRGGPIMRKHLVIACTAIIFMAIGVYFFVGNTTPTWAEVPERFYSASNFTALIYAKSHAFSEPEQIEFWFGYGDRVRILSGGKVTFAKKGFVKTFDLESRSECYPESASGNFCFHSNAFIILRLLKKMKGTTIDTAIMQMVSGSKIVDATSLINVNPEISKDIAIFDAETRGGNWRIRVWVLRESKLPIRISEWSPKGGRYETLITYSREAQPEKLFDPDAFEAELKVTSNSIFSLMYMFFKDPGKKPIPTPEN